MVVTAYYNLSGVTRVVTSVDHRLRRRDRQADGQGELHRERRDQVSHLHHHRREGSQRIELVASKATLKAKTRATVTRGGLGDGVPTGKVKFYLDKSLVKSVKLKATTTDVTLKYPKIKKAGTHKIKVVYLGDSRLEKSQKTLKVKVKK